MMLHRVALHLLLSIMIIKSKQASPEPCAPAILDESATESLHAKLPGEPRILKRHFVLFSLDLDCAATERLLVAPASDGDALATNTTLPAG
jgi:hypothetical protein